MPGTRELQLLTADQTIYGCGRPMSGEALDYMGLSPEQLALWKLRNLPLKCVYRDYDFTPEGQVWFLRRRGYSDLEIARMYPRLVGVGLDSGGPVPDPGVL